jgi:hypothetical protein
MEYINTTVDCLLNLSTFACYLLELPFLDAAHMHEVNHLSSQGREGSSEFAGTVPFHYTVPLLGLLTVFICCL